MQCGIKSRPYLVFLHFGAEKHCPGYYIYCYFNLLGDVTLHQAWLVL